jgi:predicted glycogen debranching enzyme
VLTLQKPDTVEALSVSLRQANIEDLLSKEWLLTNGRSSYASSTIIGCNTRRYHGLLIGSLNPPANRIMALAQCLEMVIINGRAFNLSTFEFDGKFAPNGFTYLSQFRQDTGVHFDYQLEKLKLTKSVYLLRKEDTVALVYDFKSAKDTTEFILRPFIGLRDFHTLQKSYAPLSAGLVNDGLLIRHNTPGSCELFLKSSYANTHPGPAPSEKTQNPEDSKIVGFEKDQQWWFNFLYRKDMERGQEFTEDLWTPGFFKSRIQASAKIILWANLSNHYRPEQLTNTSIDSVCENLLRHQATVTSAAKTRDKKFKLLGLAADQFITSRTANQNPKGTNHEQKCTVLAGFPWFVDWGRDAFIALPGLLLATGRFDQAKSLLITFAQAADEGMIPNRFDDYGDTAYFNSIDASLWFINAAFQYLDRTGDSETFIQYLLPVIRWIISSYHKGTRFGIHADTDGLITAGSEETQLTWMDAKYDGVAITARHGKAVEVNALWYNSLCLIAQFLHNDRDPHNAEHYKSMADIVRDGFGKAFWNAQAGYLNDCILPNGQVDSSLRPNQIFAVSLAFSPLTLEQQKSVVRAVQAELLTPYGLRTLSPGDTRYKGTYLGPLQQRDNAYHQGTVWPYLIGPFVEAWLKVNNPTRKNKRKAAEFIRPLLQHLTEDGCLGQLCEIFDGDNPQKPRGCFAQAWSIAELIRAYLLVKN